MSRQQEQKKTIGVYVTNTFIVYLANIKRLNEYYVCLFVSILISKAATSSDWMKNAFEKTSAQIPSGRAAIVTPTKIKCKTESVSFFG